MREPRTQAQFDDAVRDFIESLELEPSEAVQTAVEEFKMQGLDMAGVDTVWPPESRSVSPLSVAVGVVRDHVVNTDVPLTAEVVKALAAIAAIMAGALRTLLGPGAAWPRLRRCKCPERFTIFLTQRRRAASRPPPSPATSLR